MGSEYCKISLKKLKQITNKPGYHNTEFKKLFGGTKLNPCLPFSRSEFFQASPQHSQGMSISGVQQKLSLKQSDTHQLVATAEGGEYILKPSPEAYPHAAENEHAAMQVSQLLGIETAQCALVSFSEGELAYLTKRFDRLRDGNKLHQEDLLQCFDLPSEDKYSKSYEEAGKLIDKVSGGKKSVVLDFLRRVIFSYLIGNDDLHLKNISVQRLPDNKSHSYDKLSPNYDCLFCDAFNDDISGQGFLAIALLKDPVDGNEFFTNAYNYYGYYTAVDFLELGQRLELPKKTIVTFLNMIKSSQQKITDLINHSFMPTAMKARAKNIVNSRIKALSVLEFEQ